MLDNNDHPENKNTNQNKMKLGFLREETDVGRLASHIANLTEHISLQSDLIKSMAKDLMMQKRYLGHIRHLLMRLRNDDDDEDYLGLN